MSGYYSNRKLTFPIIIAAINSSKISFSSVDDESSYSTVILSSNSKANQVNSIYIKSTGQ
jgi:hypothetical protein